jgi:hypothetical protein
LAVAEQRKEVHGEMKKTIFAFLLACFFSVPHLVNGATIESMTIHESSTYNPGGEILLFGSAGEYFLTDGTSWSSGAGTSAIGRGALKSVEIFGSIIHYTFNPPNDGILYRQTDYDAGDHSSQGELGVKGPLVLKAVIGSNTARMSGNVVIVSNDMTHYGEPKFNYFSANVGTLARYSITYTLPNTAWTENIFDTPYSYTLTGHVYFTPPGKGDVDGNGDIDLQDSIIALQVLVGLSPSIGFYSSSDIDGDQKIGLAEAIFAIQKQAGLRNTAPELAPIGDQSVDENSTLIFTLLGSDPDGDALIYKATNLPEGSVLDPNTGRFSWTPLYNQSGTYGVTFSVEDRFGSSDSETITITVNDRIPVFVPTEHFPLAVGNWWDYIEDGTGQVRRTSVSGTRSIGGNTTYIVEYAEGDKEYYTSDSNGVRLHGLYIIHPEYTGEIVFNSPLLLIPNNAAVGSPEQVSSSSYTIYVYVEGYGYVPVTVDITTKTRLLAVEDVITQNRVLRDCIKVSLQMTQVIEGVEEIFPSESIHYWVYKGVGAVKETDSLSSVTIKASYVNGVNDTY